MNNPYDIHYWSKLYREERLEEASRQRLVKEGYPDRGHSTGLGRARLALAGALSVLKR